MRILGILLNKEKYQMFEGRRGTRAAVPLLLLVNSYRTDRAASFAHLTELHTVCCTASGTARTARMLRTAARALHHECARTSTLPGICGTGVRQRGRPPGRSCGCRL